MRYRGVSWSRAFVTLRVYIKYTLIFKFERFFRVTPDVAASHSHDDSDDIYEYIVISLLSIAFSAAVGVPLHGGRRDQSPDIRDGGGKKTTLIFSRKFGARTKRLKREKNDCARKPYIP